MTDTPKAPDYELAEKIDTILYTEQGNTIKRNRLIALFTSHYKSLMEEATPKIEIKAKLEALDKLILGAGEYHDDPDEYVVPLRHIQEYRAGLNQFDLSQPIFKERKD